MLRPWHNAAKYFGAETKITTGVSNAEDIARCQGYKVYENFYWNEDSTFKLVQRGDDSQPIYLPSSMRIVEAVHRFLAVKWNYIIDPRYGQDSYRGLVASLLRKLFVREQMYAKFVSQKRNGLIRGDAYWHLTADPLKEAGSRISIHELDPGLVYQILDPIDDKTVIGYHIVDTIVNPVNANLKAHRRQTYRKIDNTIESSLDIFELGKWDDRPINGKVPEVKKISSVQSIVLPPIITAFPIYHVKNRRDDFNYGSSEIRGIETVVAAINQGVSDQDLTIAMQGLGLYWTDSGPALDADGNPTTANLGPASVVEVEPGSSFNRVSGVQAGLPGIEHMKFLLENAESGIGIPPIAVGNVDVSVATSGIALALQLAPLLSRNEEKESELLSVMDHMLYDLVTRWFIAYEGLPVDLIEVASIVGNPMPRDRDSEIAEIISLVTSVPQIIPLEVAHAKLEELGYEFPENTMDLINAQAQSLDPYFNRANVELETLNVPTANPAISGNGANPAPGPSQSLLPTPGGPA